MRKNKIFIPILIGAIFLSGCEGVVISDINSDAFNTNPRTSHIINPNNEKFHLIKSNREQINNKVIITYEYQLDE